jgi:hypothetical protein
MAKNPPPTGAARSVTNDHVREIIKGRPEPGAPPQRERKNLRRTPSRAATEEPSAASKSDEPNADDAGGPDEV